MNALMFSLIISSLNAFNFREVEEEIIRFFSRSSEVVEVVDDDDEADVGAVNLKFLFLFFFFLLLS